MYMTTTDLAVFDGIPAAAIRELEKLADELEVNAAEHRYKAAGLMAQAAADGHSLRKIGRAIDKTHTHVRKCVEAYAAMAGSVDPSHFQEFYRRARGTHKPSRPKPPPSGNLGFHGGSLPFHVSEDVAEEIADEMAADGGGWTFPAGYRYGDVVMDLLSPDFIDAQQLDAASALELAHAMMNAARQLRQISFGSAA